MSTAAAAGGRVGRRRRRRLAVSTLLAALVAVLGPGLSLPSVALAQPERTASGSGSAQTSLTLSLVRVSPATLTPTTDLVIQATARNTSGAEIRNAKVRLRLHALPLTTRTSIDDWQAGGVITADAVLPGTAKIHDLAPGQTQSFTITVPAGRTGLGALSSFGARGIALEALSKTGGRQLGVLRTTVVWSPPTARPTRTRLSLLVPFTASYYSENAGAPTATVSESFEAGGRMNRLLQAAADSSISWALDPAVLESSQRLASTGEVPSADDDPLAATPSPTSSGSQKDGDSSDEAAARQAASSWLGTLKRERGTRTTFALPYADPDLTSLLRSTRGLGLLRTADQLGKAASLAALGRSADTSIAWPGDGQVTPAGITALSRAGKTAIVLPASAQPPTTAAGYTPTGRSTVRSGGAELTGLLYDDQLSSLFAESGQAGSNGAAGGSDTSSDTSGATSPAAATQTMLSQLAAISTELPGQARQVLAVAPRDWSPNAAGVQTLLNDLHSVGWVSLKGLSDLRATTSSTPRGEPSYHKNPTKAELPIGNVSGATAMIRDLNTLAPTLADPEAVVGPLQEQVVSLLSLGWRSNKDGLSSARSDVRDNVEKLVGGIKLLVGEKTKTLAAHSASIPVTVTNSTPYDMDVVVQLVPGSGQLAIPGKVAVHAIAHSRNQVLVPARAIANGNVTVEGKLLTPKGKQLGSTGTFTLRARPDWETGGTIAAGVILGLLLILGLLRGIGRGRTRIPPQAVPDVDDQASGRRPPEPDRVSEPVEAAEAPTRRPEPGAAPRDRSDRSTQDRSDLQKTLEPAITGAFGEDAGRLDGEDLARSQEFQRSTTRAEERPRAASETRPAAAPEPSGPAGGTVPDGAHRRPAISRETR